MVQVHRPTRLQRLFSWALFSQLASVSVLVAAQREACQTFITTPDLSKCPDGTIYVSMTDKKAQFNSVQKAINKLQATAATTPATILIGAGNYLERVVVDSFKSITLLGQVLVPNPSYESNTVNITHGRTLQKSDGYANWNTATLLVNRTNTFKSYNLNVRQTATSGIALSVAVMNSSASFYATGMFGRQDTLFIGPNHTRVYIFGCYIEGTVDFIYGWGTLVVKYTRLAVVGKGTSIAAWRGGESKTSGAYFFGSSFDQAANTFEAIPKGSVAVARPWNPIAKVILFNCYLGNAIRSEVFTPWAKTDPRLSPEVVLAEYDSTGPGSKGVRKLVSSGSKKVDLQHLSYLLDQKSASLYSLSMLFPDGTGWIDLKFDVKASHPNQGRKPSSSSGTLPKAPGLVVKLPPVSESNGSGTKKGLSRKKKVNPNKPKSKQYGSKCHKSGSKPKPTKKTSKSKEKRSGRSRGSHLSEGLSLASLSKRLHWEQDKVQHSHCRKHYH